MKYFIRCFRFCSDALFPSLSGNLGCIKFVDDVCAMCVMHGVEGFKYLICVGSVMASQRGPLHVVLVIRPYLPLVCKSYKETCFSDPAARSIWNIPRDHLLLMWCQIHSREVQVSLSLSHGKHILLTVSIQHFLTSLICIFN